MKSKITLLNKICKDFELTINNGYRIIAPMKITDIAPTLFRGIHIPGHDGAHPKPSLPDRSLPFEQRWQQAEILPPKLQMEFLNQEVLAVVLKLTGLESAPTHYRFEERVEIEKDELAASKLPEDIKQSLVDYFDHRKENERKPVTQNPKTGEYIYYGVPHIKMVLCANNNSFHWKGFYLLIANFSPDSHEGLAIGFEGLSLTIPISTEKRVRTHASFSEGLFGGQRELSALDEALKHTNPFHVGKELLRIADEKADTIKPPA